MESEVDPKHREEILEYFDFEEGHTDGQSITGAKDRKVQDQDYEREEVDGHEATILKPCGCAADPGAIRRQRRLAKVG